MPTRPDRNDFTKLPYWLNVLVALDQLANAVAAGNPDSTVSARVGYFASKEEGRAGRGYWRILESTIDFAFHPIQGPGHCHNAWLGEKDEPESPGTSLSRIFLGVGVFLCCAIIGCLLRVAVLVYPPWGFKPEKIGYAMWRQARWFRYLDRETPLPIATDR